MIWGRQCRNVRQKKHTYASRTQQHGGQHLSEALALEVLLWSAVCAQVYRRAPWRRSYARSGPRRHRALARGVAPTWRGVRDILSGVGDVNRRRRVASRTAVDASRCQISAASVGCCWRMVEVACPDAASAIGGRRNRDLLEPQPWEHSAHAHPGRRPERLLGQAADTNRPSPNHPMRPIAACASSQRRPECVTVVKFARPIAAIMHAAP
jgi:hypothetical protein